ncbi:UDP-N-acetylglucosamine/UDP-N-acetylgalactosamine diphosphorylase [Nematocida sp. LUAm3]|nr:UDP-N-acetylglucosamine/UDP-N-acetylgalactosamine diphosphorylase [Nematocida sp. LUAm3]KAI5175207.1 UDP-N-acetylglucosamine/UDP-N-acetylgalactosamine diphosphorylase [Nematocida sp. LUAm2]KAI5178121.1 UDP-N-acetylglucosamine/UDP-N-acetylgalactosamine diphosphorylase [Nematocida sp. LUAm1]
MEVLSIRDSRNGEIEEKGKSILNRKEVAVVTLAGGVGSRLGYSGPKGLFEIEAKNRKASLFQRQKEKIKEMPWIIMVSPSTKPLTIQHLQGIISSEEHLYLIEQEEVEALSEDRNILEDANGLPIKLPNGNGSLFSSLQKQKYILISKTEVKYINRSILCVLNELSIKYLNIISIDNVLVRVGDLRMLGWIEETRSDVVSAGIPIKRGKLGLFVKHNGKVSICEYTDSPKGDPLISSENLPLGNIANHIVRISFLNKIDSSFLRYHDAHKKIPHSLDLHPVGPNAIKRELFIFDGFNLSESHSVVEYDESSYEGLKNKEGNEDSISSCVNALEK